jgi:uncharacterized membrane protein YfcA
MIAGIIAGFVIGVIASLLGVAGGEFLIPTLVLLFGADIKLAGSLRAVAIGGKACTGMSRNRHRQGTASESKPTGLCDRPRAPRWSCAYPSANPA